MKWQFHDLQMRISYTCVLKCYKCGDAVRKISFKALGLMIDDPDKGQNVGSKLHPKPGPGGTHSCRDRTKRTSPDKQRGTRNSSNKTAMGQDLETPKLDGQIV